jgi:hypothetical protein
MEINTSGYYKFTGNITVNAECSYGYGCIEINASSVTLNLNGHALINNDSCSDGIVILAKNLTDETETQDNIQILNGYIIDFPNTGINLYGAVADSSFTYLYFIGIYGDSDGVAINTEYNDNLMIGTNWFIGGQNAVITVGDCGGVCYLYDNIIKHMVNGFYLGNGFDIQRNEIGYSIRNGTSCSQNDYPTEYGIFCYNCGNNTIKNNDIMSQYALTLENTANNNNITDNIFRTFYNYDPIITFGISTTDNLFCNNVLIKSYPILQSINGEDTCYFGTQTSNAMSIVDNQGTNTVTELCSENCLAGWYCQGNNRLNINSSCSITANYTCEYGCESGIYGAYCIGQQSTNQPCFCDGATSCTSAQVGQYINGQRCIGVYELGCGAMYCLIDVEGVTTTVLIPQWNNTSNQPVVNITDLNEAGLNWMMPFFTPTFLIIVFEIIISSIVAWLSHQQLAFPITIFVLTALIGYYGMFSFGITMLICTISALSVALLWKTMVK